MFPKTRSIAGNLAQRRLRFSSSRAECSARAKAFREQGSNGLAVDAEGRLLICQHGERRLARLNADGSQTVLADKFEGKRFNSPNDLALRKNGDIYFTDPPYGLDGLNKSPLKEISWNGVYRRAADGAISLLVKDITFPNGIAFSPDEKILYVAVSDSQKPHLMAYDVQPDGSVTNGRVFFDATPLKGRKGSCDGMKVDATGTVFATGPGGVLIISPAGKHLGTLLDQSSDRQLLLGRLRRVGTLHHRGHVLVPG